MSAPLSPPSSSSSASSSEGVEGTPTSSMSSSEALLTLLSPDGYYIYLGISKPSPPTAAGLTTATTTTIDEEQVKRSYRKLSLKHHPDRPTGDADTFRVLKRAQIVLLTPKLRQQYDLLGLDLEDDEDAMEASDANSTPTPDETSSSNNNTSSQEENSDGGNTPEGIINQLASATLSSIFQVMVRTVMMGFVAVVVVRYRITLYAASAFLLFVAYRVHSAMQANQANSSMDVLSPFMIGIGLFLMNRGRHEPDLMWSWTFWTGESLVLTMFTFNSIQTERTPTLGMGIFLLSLLLTLWLRGNMWRYLTIFGLEGFVAIIVALGFPIMEMILEQILNEKLRKIGEKVRAHSDRLRDFYTNQK